MMTPVVPCHHHAGVAPVAPPMMMPVSPHAGSVPSPATISLRASHVSPSPAGIGKGVTDDLAGIAPSV